MGNPRDQIKRDFAKRLQDAMFAKGWNQAELARRASAHTKGKRFGRDNVSNYMRARALPGPLHLAAMAKALGVKPDDLLPTRGVSSADSDKPPFAVQTLEDGNVWLRVNQSVPPDVALKVMALLQGRADAPA